MPLPTPRKVTVERMSPSLRTHSNSFNSLVEEPSDQLLDRLIESKAFAAKVQQYVHHAVDAAVERSLRSFAGDVQRRFEAVESLVEAIGAAVAEVCDDADEAAPHAAQAPPPHGSNKSGSLHTHGRSQRSAGETEAKGPSPRGSPKQQELVELLDDSVTLADTPRRKANGVMDPYAEVARLRDTLEHVSHLAREAQEELSIEREEMEETIADLRAQLFHARDGASGSAVGGPATQRSE
jgi:ribosome assembly protein YihI (activator of Der GTPase)